MSGASYLFFIGLAIAIVYIYLAMRRGWDSPRRVVMIGVPLCAVAMSLVQAANPGADIARAVLYGVPLGASIGLATAAVAWYFARSETRGTAPDEQIAE